MLIVIIRVQGTLNKNDTVQVIFKFFMYLTF